MSAIAADVPRDRVIAAISALSADASVAEITAAVKAAMLPTEPRYVGAVVRISGPEPSVFVRVDESDTAWIEAGRQGRGWHSWQTLCEYGAPVELVPITELERAQQEYRGTGARFSRLRGAIFDWMNETADAAGEADLNKLNEILEAGRHDAA